MQIWSSKRIRSAILLGKLTILYVAKKYTN
jgi:hypothetical protein